jgi:hypothetical protein
MIKSTYFSGFVYSAALTVISTTAYAQTVTSPGAAASRMEIRMERDEFLKTHRYDDSESEWLPTTPTNSNLTRVEAKAARNQYLANHRWDEASDSFMPLGGTPRAMSSLTREEVKMETMQFTRTHAWDNQTSKWVMKSARAKR